MLFSLNVLRLLILSRGVYLDEFPFRCAFLFSLSPLSALQWTLCDPFGIYGPLGEKCGCFYFSRIFCLSMFACRRKYHPGVPEWFLMHVTTTTMAELDSNHLVGAKSLRNTNSNVAFAGSSSLKIQTGKDKSECLEPKKGANFANWISRLEVCLGLTILPRKGTCRELTEGVYTDEAMDTQNATREIELVEFGEKPRYLKLFNKAVLD